MAKGIYDRTDEIKLKMKEARCSLNNKPIDDKERFLSYIKVNAVSGCWEWQARRHKKGYGYFVYKKKWMACSRVAWLMFNGDIPENLSVLHKCDNRSCCNPDHLFLGTQKDNMADMVAKGRSKMCSLPGSKSGMAKLTESQVIKIRELYKLHNTISDIARNYCVSWTTIKNIIDRNTWKHI